MKIVIYGGLESIEYQVGSVLPDALNQSSVESNYCVMPKIRKIKLLYISTNLILGGAEKMLFNILSNIDREVFEPTVISLMRNGPVGQDIEGLGISVHEVNTPRGRASIASLLSVYRLVRELKPDVIQGWMYHGNLVAFFAGFFSKGRTTVFWSIHHSLHSIKNEARLTRLIISLSSVLSRWIASTLYVSHTSKVQHEDVGYSKCKGEVIPNGFDMIKFQPNPAQREILRDSICVPEDSFLLGTVARYHPLKGYDVLLQAISLFLTNHPSAHIVLVGPGVTYENTELVCKMESLNISKNVHLLGVREDIPDVIAALDLVTLSSLSEAFPMVIGEAMATGVPCVCTDVGDARWIVGDVGEVVAASDPSALASAWENFVELDVKKRELLSLQARERIQRNFSLKDIVKKYEQLYTRSIRQSE